MVLVEPSQAVLQVPELVLADQRDAAPERFRADAARRVEGDRADAVAEERPDQLVPLLESGVGEREVEPVGEGLAQIGVVNDSEAARGLARR